MPTGRSASATLTKMNKPPKLCKFTLSCTTPSGMSMKITAGNILPAFMHALIRCAQWVSGAPDPTKKPDAKPDYVFLDKEQIGQLKEQIMIVLADYQNTGVTQCPKCHEPFADVIQKCPKCNFDSLGFARGEGTRIEVANRVIGNMKIIGEGFGPEEKDG